MPAQNVHDSSDSQDAKKLAGESLLQETAAPIAQTRPNPPTSPEITTPSADTEQPEFNNSSREIKKLIEEDFTQNSGEHLPPYEKKTPIQNFDKPPSPEDKTQEHTNKPTSPENEASQAGKDRDPPKKKISTPNFHSLSQLTAFTAAFFARVMARLIAGLLTKNYRAEKMIMPSADTYRGETKQFADEKIEHSGKVATYDIKQAHFVQPPNNPAINATTPFPSMPMSMANEDPYAKATAPSQPKPMVNQTTQGSPDRDQPSSAHQAILGQAEQPGMKAAQVATQNTPGARLAASAQGKIKSERKPQSRALRRSSPYSPPY